MTINKSIIVGILGELPGGIIKTIDQKLKKALLLQ
jgi:CheY-specific phosphatase CheX